MLQTQLSQQLKNLAELQATLAEEKRCLTEKDFTAFNDTLFNKQKLLQSIATLDKQLSTEISLEQIKQSKELTTQKKNLEIQLQSCQKLNSVNGKLVELSMKSNKHLMQLITQATGQNSVTYDQKGLLKGGSLLGKNIQA
ncbi:flagellar protein FlgN [Psychromonas hadalis]|uniref:flagellar protein FlgN n=1 Tax=Psychromonas hadalis TaxID=211669 RepID=UPI0003B6E66D|nr:flagellar protein FlgN [Psychromonas hadalis]